MKKERGVLIIEIELIGMSDELMSEFLVNNLFDIGLIETVFKRALVAESKTVIAFVLNEQVGLFFLLLLSFMWDLFLLFNKIIVILSLIIRFLIVLMWSLGSI